MAFLRRSRKPPETPVICAFCKGFRTAGETLVLDMHREARRVGSTIRYKHVCQACVLEHCTELYQEFVVKELTR